MTHGRDSYARPDLLVETDWLAQHLNDPGVRIIDCDPYDSYRRAHIPGAVGIQVHHYIKDASNSVYVMPPDQFAQLMGQLGVGPETLVVTYDGFGSLYAARMWWVLSYYGHTRVKVLNGGWDKWLKEGRSITRQVPRVARAAFTPQVDPNLICTLDYA
ncbi:MAG: sulfurtransferase, partial [Chloroflexi bacterium]|nr:sulfurtransferase [Chloroflexota bacterium]